MKLRFTIVMLVSMILASCSQKEEVIVSDYNSTYLNAKIESTQNTKVGFTASNADFFWTKGDVIGVITQSSETFLAMNLSDDDAGKATGTFSGNISGIIGGYAVYPFGELGRHSLQGTTLTYKLPDEYTYATTDAEYAKSDGNSHNAPMWGAVNGSAVTFKHLGGVLAFEINNLPENTQNLKLTLTAENKISGTFTANLNTNTPVITTEATQNEADKKVTIKFNTVAGQSTGYFYIPVPTGEIGNLVLSVTDANSTLVASGAWDNRTIERKNIVRIKIGNQSLVGGEGEVKSVSNVSEINSTVLSTTNQDEENLIVNVTSELSGTDNNISIPSSLTTETTTFSFSSVADGAKISITNGDGAEYSGKIVIEIPEDETLPTIEANIPDGEVYIKQGNVEYLVVSAAQNTTIIGEKAKVTNLTVNKGNIRILTGGKVTNITKGTINTDELTYVIFEGGIPDELPTITNDEETIVFISAAEYDLRKAIEEATGNMPTITLKEDVVLTSQLTINKSLTLNLNGKTIRNEDDIWDDTDGIDTWSLISVQGNGTDGNPVDVAIKGNGKVLAKSGDCYAVDVRNKAVVKIEDGTFAGNISAVYAISDGQAYIAGGNYSIQQLSKYNDYRYLLNIHSNTDGYIEVTGGTFANYDPANSNGENPIANFIPAGYSSIADNDGNYTVKEGIYNETALRYAISATENNSIITLNNNIVLSSQLTIGNNITVNLNGNTLTTSTIAANNDDIIVNGTLNIYNGTIKTANAAFWVKGNLNLKDCEIQSTSSSLTTVFVSDNGKLEATNCTANVICTAFKATSGSMTLKNCTVSSSHTNGYANVTVTGDGTILNIDGGSYTGKKTDYLYDSYVVEVRDKAKATINTTVSGGNGGVTVIGASTATLTGGSYTGTKACGLYVAGESEVTYNNCTFSGAEGDVVVGGGTYGSGTVNGTTYTVYTKIIKQVSTLADLTSVLESGGHAVLASNSNISLTSAISVAEGKNVIIDLNGNTLTTSTTAANTDDIIVNGTLNIYNGTIKTANAAFWVKGNLNLKDCEIQSTSSSLTTVFVSDNGKLEATNCTANVICTAFKATSGSMTLKNCTVSSSHTNGYANVTVTGDGTILNIDGGSYTGKKTDYLYDSYVVEVRDKAKATINTTVSGGNGGVTVIGASTATLTGGSYTGTKACGLYVAGESEVTYNNCTFSGAEGDVVVGGGTYGSGTVNGIKYTVYTKIQ